MVEDAMHAAGWLSIAWSAHADTMTIGGEPMSITDLVWLFVSVSSLQPLLRKSVATSAFTPSR